MIHTYQSIVKDPSFFQLIFLIETWCTLFVYFSKSSLQLHIYTHLSPELLLSHLDHGEYLWNQLCSRPVEAPLVDANALLNLLELLDTPQTDIGPFVAAQVWASAIFSVSCREWFLICSRRFNQAYHPCDRSPGYPVCAGTMEAMPQDTGRLSKKSTKSSVPYSNLAS